MNILLLHGAIGAADQLETLKQALAPQHQVFSLTFGGHGGSNPDGNAFSIAAFANEVLHFLDQQQLPQVTIFGYSMGGYVAAFLARQQPQRVTRIVTLATKWHWDEATAAKETKMLNPDKIEEKLPAFAQALATRHGNQYWKNVLHKTAAMLTEMGKDNPLKPEDLSAIQCPVLVSVGDRDTMVSLDETIAAYRHFPNGALAVLPHTPHPIEKVQTKQLVQLLEG